MDDTFDHIDDAHQDPDDDFTDEFTASSAALEYEPLADDISLSKPDSGLDDLNIATDLTEQDLQYADFIVEESGDLAFEQQTEISEQSLPATGANPDQIIADNPSIAYSAEIETLATMFDPAELPTPGGGFPWVDTDLIGQEQLLASELSTEAVAPPAQLQAELAGFENGQDSSEQSPTWSQLASSTDPSVQALAKLWQQR